MKNLFQHKFRSLQKIIAPSKENSTPDRSFHRFSRYLRRKVRIDCYLPPGYHQARSRDRDYPLLCFNDGQDLPAVRLASTLDRLYREDRIEPLIALAFHAGDRLQEYGVSGRPDYLQRGSMAEDYAQFVLWEFLPRFRQQFRCRPHAGDHAFAGFSRGGLSAFDIAWHHPRHFGKVGVFSGSLWWRAKAFQPADPDADRIAHALVREGPAPTGLQFWFQTGTLDETSDRNGNGVIDSIDDTLDLLECLREAGYDERDLRYLEVENGRHHPDTWAQALPDFLEWAFGPKDRQ